MKDDLYLISNGMFYRERNTLIFVGDGDKIVMPINTISSIHCFGKASLSSMVIDLLFEKNIPVHFFKRYGSYTGSLFPKRWNFSGKLLVKQCECFLKDDKRHFVAKSIVNGTRHSMISIMRDYKDARGMIAELKFITLPDSSDMNQLRSSEGRIWKVYYSFIDQSCKFFSLGARTFHPPNNELNAMISFGNALLYGVVLTEIYNTQLDASVSFLHEPQDRRHSFMLDISEMFKPIIVGRMILSLSNKQKIKARHFEKKNGGCYLNRFGRKIFVEDFNARMRATVKHKELKRDVSYRQLIRLECYRFINHFLENKEYSAFEPWW